MPGRSKKFQQVAKGQRTLFDALKPRKQQSSGDLGATSSGGDIVVTACTLQEDVRRSSHALASSSGLSQASIAPQHQCQEQPGQPTYLSLQDEFYGCTSLTPSQVLDSRDQSAELRLQGSQLLRRQHSGQKPQLFTDFLVYDFEATTNEARDLTPMELIEFSCCILDATTLSITAEFQEYLRPTENQILTAFCTNLTGITQDRYTASFCWLPWHINAPCLYVRLVHNRCVHKPGGMQPFVVAQANFCSCGAGQVPCCSLT